MKLEKNKQENQNKIWCQDFCVAGMKVTSSFFITMTMLFKGWGAILKVWVGKVIYYPEIDKLFLELERYTC